MKTKWLILSLICLGVTSFISCSQPGPTIDEPTIDPADVIATGTWSDSLTWTLAKDGLLLISGKGDMMSIYDEMSVDTCYPWYNYKEYITRIYIGDGVTSIGGWALSHLYHMMISIM